MMRSPIPRFWFVLALSIGLTVLTTTPAWSQPTGAFGKPDHYVVTLKSCDISKDAGTTWISLWTTDKTLNIASIATPGKAGDFAANVPLVPGTYNRIRCTVSKTMQIRGTVSFGGSTYYTKNAATDSTTAPAEISTVDIPVGDVTGTYTINVVITAGLTGNTQVNFALTNAMQLYQVTPGVYKIYPEPPNVSSVTLR